MSAHVTRLTRTKNSPASANETPANKQSPNVGEVAGGTAANIFVVCCCCPCGLLECLVMTIYKIPASIVRRMWRKRRCRKLAKMRSSKKVLLGDGGGGAHGGGGGAHGVEYYCDERCDIDLDEFEKKANKVSVGGSGPELELESKLELELELELDRRMWDLFCDTGFWRTCSQRHITTAAT